MEDLEPGRAAAGERAVIAAPTGAPEHRVRLAKALRILHERAGVRIEYWGWQRATGEKMGAGVPGVIASRTLLVAHGFRDSKARLCYVLWAASMFWSVLWRGPERVYCLGFETALPTWLASRLRRRVRYVFDDADRFVQARKMPRPVDWLLRRLELRVSRASVAHIVPSLELYDFRTDKIRLVRNMPMRSQILAAEREPIDKVRDVFGVYVNGWLDETRGLSVIEACARILEDEGDRSIVFWTATPLAFNRNAGLFSRSNVRDLGSLNQVDALAHYRKCDVVLTLCDQRTIPSYRYSWMNKWGDAISMGTPIIVNRGIITAEPFFECGAAFPCDYDDAKGLAQLLRSLQSEPARLEKAKAALKLLQQEVTTYDESLQPIFDEWLGQRKKNA